MVDIVDKRVAKTSKIVVGTPFKVPIRRKSNGTLKPLLKIGERLLPIFRKDEVDRRQVRCHAV